jgi:preprotein translocase subunit SecD
MRATTTIATCKKAGLFGLFLWLAAVAAMAPGTAETLLEKLKKSEQSAPPPAVPGQPGQPSPTRKNLMPPLRLQIESATPVFDARTKEPVISIRLTERSGRMFAELTKENVGRRTEVRIDGKVVMSPIIREPILGGSLQVSGDFTLKDAQEIADRLNSGAARVEVEVVD